MAGSVVSSPWTGLELLRRQRSRRHQCIMELVGVSRVGTRLLAHPVDGSLIERCHVGTGQASSASCLHGARATLFQRGIVEKCVRLGVQDVVREDRRFRRVARYQADLSAMNPAKDRLQPFEVHCLL
jgi:hypothetical protein